MILEIQITVLIQTSGPWLTIACVKVEISRVELLGCIVTSLPSLGRRITLNVMVRLEVWLLSLVVACKSSFVIGAEEPGRERE